MKKVSITFTMKELDVLYWAIDGSVDAAAGCYKGREAEEEEALVEARDKIGVVWNKHQAHIEHDRESWYENEQP